MEGLADRNVFSDMSAFPAPNQPHHAQVQSR